MSRQKIIKITMLVLVFILIAGMLQQGYMKALTIMDKQDKLKDSGRDIGAVQGPKGSKGQPDIKGQAQSAISSDDAAQVKRLPKKDVDTSKIVISKEMDDFIKKADGKNAAKHLKDYKTLLAELNVPDNFRSEMERLIRQKHKIADVFTAYEFLYENYGKISELEGLLTKRESNKTWAEVFTGYDSASPEFVPRSFPPGYIENLLKNPSITADDVMNADRISQRGLKTFEQLIDMRKQGKKWKEISSSLGIVNTSEKLPRFAITGEQVKKYMAESGLGEKEVVEAMILAAKTGKADAEVIAKVKSGGRKEDIYAWHYDEKYR